MRHTHAGTPSEAAAPQVTQIGLLLIIMMMIIKTILLRIIVIIRIIIERFMTSLTSKKMNNLR